MHQARFYHTIGADIQCELCLHQCVIKNNRFGRCGVRKHIDGVLYSTIYRKLVAEQIDPVEKKPLFHVWPGSLTYSLATKGCNFRCLHCQNYSISQVSEDLRLYQGLEKSPQEVVTQALSSGCRSISYTYVEPTVFFEYAYDCCVKARQHNLGNLFISNGYMGKGAASLLAPVLDGINIDLKSFRESFYQDICGATLQPVLDNICFFRAQGVWVEVTTLVVPGLNDSDEELHDIASFLAATDPDIAWHVSGFRPTYKMQDRPPTSPATLIKAREIGLSHGLRHVYVGNLRNVGGEDTYCPGCSAVLIKRAGFHVLSNQMQSGLCPDCGNKIAGFW